MIRQMGPKPWMVRVVVNQAKTRAANQGLNMESGSEGESQIPLEYQLPSPWKFSQNPGPCDDKRMKQHEAKQKVSWDKGVAQVSSQHQMPGSDGEATMSDPCETSEDEKVISNYLARARMSPSLDPAEAVVGSWVDSWLDSMLAG